MRREYVALGLFLVVLAIWAAYALLFRPPRPPVAPSTPVLVTLVPGSPPAVTVTNTRVPTGTPEPAVIDMRPTVSASPTFTPVPPLILLDPTATPTRPPATMNQKG